MENMKLSKDKYVLYNKLKGSIIKDEMYGEFLIFESKEEAECYRTEALIPCTDLPKHLQEKLIDQFKINERERR